MWLCRLSLLVERLFYGCHIALQVPIRFGGPYQANKAPGQVEILAPLPKRLQGSGTTASGISLHGDLAEDSPFGLDSPKASAEAVLRSDPSASPETIDHRGTF